MGRDATENREKVGRLCEWWVPSSTLNGNVQLKRHLPRLCNWRLSELPQRSKLFLEGDARWGRGSDYAENETRVHASLSAISTNGCVLSFTISMSRDESHLKVEIPGCSPCRRVSARRSGIRQKCVRGRWRACLDRPVEPDGEEDRRAEDLTSGRGAYANVAEGNVEGGGRAREGSAPRT
eukprot:5085507-Pleurochrysis_carterae.AAC.1